MMSHSGFELIWLEKWKILQCDLNLKWRENFFTNPNLSQRQPNDLLPQSRADSNNTGHWICFQMSKKKQSKPSHLKNMTIRQMFTDEAKFDYNFMQTSYHAELGVVMQ